MPFAVDHPSTCTFVDLELVPWSLPKLVLVIFELFVIAFANLILPQLIRDLINSGRLPIYLKFLLGAFFLVVWANEALRVVQVLMTRPNLLRSYLPYYVHAFLGRETFAYSQAFLFLLILFFLLCELSSVMFRASINKVWMALPLAVLMLVLCALYIIILNMVDITLETFFLLRTIVLSGVFQAHFCVSRQSNKLIRRPEHFKKGYLMTMQRTFRRAVRGCRYMRLQLKIYFILFVINSVFTAFAYFVSLPQCSVVWLQINSQLGELANASLFIVSIFNCSHYMGGKIHRIIARILPSQKINSTASTEPLYYNTELLNPQEAHFRQLAIMWTTYSSAYPQYYAPVESISSMEI